MRRTLLFAASLAVLATAAGAEQPFNFETTPGNLPKIVRPSAYRIDLVTDMDKLTLAGRETIEIDLAKPTDTIVLNQAGLTLSSAALETGAKAAIGLDEKAQIATLKFSSALAAGKHSLVIVYTGPIPETPNGIYFDDYKDASGAKKRMLVTQFEVGDARRMFPGWDEPSFKATFQLNVTLPKAYAAVSNMPITATKPVGSGQKTVSFAVSPMMSSYLVALVAGDIRAVTGEAAGVKMGAWAPSGRQEQGRYALQAEEKILPFYNQYFAAPYPLPKLDMLAIPGNYEAGAMENWGAITYIDDAMLFDPKTSSADTREGIFSTVAHEMAHQWSGDLVTMAWWDNIWLNEGFATWMANKATDHFNPTWQVRVREHGERESAMGQDARATTHPIQQVIRDESEANSAFDSISYEKGGQVLNMIEDWIGPDVFRDGMRHYMAAHRYSNATSADLWAALSQASGKDVAKVARSFTEQPGIPLVKASLSEARSCNLGSITLSQSRFTIDDPNPKAQTWTIPITLGGSSQTKHVLLGSEAVTVPFNTCEGVKVGLGESGYYRAEYDAPLLAKLNKGFAALAPADRANLLGDQYALFLGERAALKDYMDLLPKLKGETNIAVWQDTLGHLHSLHNTLRGSPDQAAFDTYVIGLVKPAFDRLGWSSKPGEGPLDAQMRPMFISSLGLFGDQAVITEANRRFEAFRHDPNALEPALRSAVLTIVGKNADRTTWEALRDMGTKATSTEEKLRYFGAMAEASDPELMRANVAFADSGEIPNGRIVQFLAEASQGSGKPDEFYALVVPHEAELSKRIPGDGISPTALVAAAAGSYDPATADKLLAAPSSSASNGTQVMAVRAAAGIHTSARLRARIAPAVHDWLASRR